MAERQNRRPHALELHALNGISFPLTEIQDATLDGIAPAGYYRATFQSRSYTERHWGTNFEILDYRARAIVDYQDLVILRRR